MMPSQATIRDPQDIQCLGRLLAALNWNGPADHLSQALPDEHAELDHVDLRNVLAELGWIARPIRASRLQNLTRDRLPVLLAAEAGRLLVIEPAREADTVMVFELGVGARPVALGALPHGRFW